MGDLEAITGAAKGWQEFAFGSMLAVMCVWHYLTVKAHREEIREWKAELQKERESHDRTRERHENNNNAIRGLTEAIKLTQDGLRELAFERRQS